MKKQNYKEAEKFALWKLWEEKNLKIFFLFIFPAPILSFCCWCVVPPHPFFSGNFHVPPLCAPLFSFCFNFTSESLNFILARSPPPFFSLYISSLSTHHPPEISDLADFSRRFAPFFFSLPSFHARLRGKSLCAENLWFELLAFRRRVFAENKFSKLENLLVFIMFEGAVLCTHWMALLLLLHCCLWIVWCVSCMWMLKNEKWERRTFNFIHKPLHFSHS